MKTLKKLFIVTAPIAVFSTALISCQKDIRFSVNKPWFGEEKSDFFNKVVEEYNKENKSSNSVSVKFEPNNADIIENIKKGSQNIGIVTSTLFNDDKSNKDFMTPIIQTLTRAQKFDLNNFDAKYSNGGQEDSLVKIANEAYKSFAEKPYKDWEDDEYGWNGNIYEKFYGTKEQLSEYYRGLVMIQGTDDEIKEIRAAWDSKDWNKFRNFGIGHGKRNSGSKWFLQEALFKKHFNLENNKFVSFAQDLINNQDKYIEMRSRDIARGANTKYHIVFDELGSFAYTYNSDKKTNKVHDYYTPEKSDVKIEFLTVTEALKYNIFVVDNKTFSIDQQKIMANAILNVWKQGKDNYGPTVGFNGYKIIVDFQKEVIEPFENLFK
ncbi:ABC transporter thiamine pyrophosphate-binding lipoprotein p37/Cypl [Mycoplasma phocoeninasale]|uniref:Alkylphosphonate ABC transporter substrate-binidng protein n=1 Tax=Mycoplasma phocoeninasale TaxID=2726117 RepID=A0A858U2N3_9MOLU|nr:alkylphosphonate ABC transporter substrate-binidng protein [Mycoplasma phocoeninasale]MBN0970583.1 alkylphosphonate ABC transporter substrate-binidng protein [Mycoplasma phocoeninasale]QJG66299.1 alkylphosphonate ABC transporter substrate-binidng protein [Mycoplasma phocoeninasale]